MPRDRSTGRVVRTGLSHYLDSLRDSGAEPSEKKYAREPPGVLAQAMNKLSAVDKEQRDAFAAASRKALVALARKLNLAEVEYDINNHITYDGRGEIVLRTRTLCVSIDVYREQDRQVAWQPVDVSTGELLASPNWTTANALESGRLAKKIEKAVPWASDRRNVALGGPRR